MTKPELPEWIERIQGREQKATPQPWKRHPNSKYWVLLPLPENAVNLNDENDAQFAANARQDIPALLQHCLKLRETLAFFQNPDDWEDYYESDTGYGYFRFFKREDLKAGMPFDLVVEALNHIPQGETK